MRSTAFFKWSVILLLFGCASCSDSVERLEKDYELNYNPNEEIEATRPVERVHIIEIPGHILFYGHNKDFILVNQKPADSIYDIDEDLNFD